jgi:uncharacterized protein (TIGR00288 family)
MTSNKTLVAIYVDLQNVLSIQKEANLLLDFAKFKGDLVETKVYYNSQFQNQTAAIKKLKSLGFDCVDVPCLVKNSADNQLKSDLMDAIYSDRSPDIIILASGDGDFASQVRFLKEGGKKAIVFARRGNVKKQLKNLANQFYCIEELPELLTNKNQDKTTKLQSQITWDNAVNCLIETLKSAAKQGKPTTLPYIGKQIRQSLSLSKKQKFVVYKNDGSKITNLSKFVKELASHGKLIVDGDRLLLPGK